MSRPRGISSEFAALLALAVAVAFAIPVLWMFAASFKPEQAIHEDLGSLRSFVTFSPTSEHYIATFRRGDVSTTLVNTFIAVALIALGGLCVNAPAAYRFTAPGCPERHLEGAELLGASVEGVSVDDAGAVLAGYIEQMMQATGVPNGISGVGFNEADVPALAEAAGAQQRLLSVSPRPVTLQDLCEVYADALSYW